MAKNRADHSRYRELSEKHGLTDSEVERIVSSYFSILLTDARSLPFDNPRRIYSKESFEDRIKVRNIPYLGRLGPVYSRYLKWRANVSEQLVMAPRSSYRRRITQGEIESTAEAILSGSTPPPLRKRKGTELFERVWLVGQDGKKSARQVIPKENP